MMNGSLSTTLYEKFPELFRQDLLTNGFECQNGWFSLLHELAEQIYIQFQNELLTQSVEVMSVQQDFGQLRIVTGRCDEAIRELLNLAERKSTTICELDGNPATGLFACAPHWHRYLCETCAELHECMRGEDEYLHDALPVSLHELKTLSNGSVFV